MTIKLQAPSRKAAKISSISGVISVFSPTEANKSILTFENLPKLYDKNLLKGKYSSVKLTLLNPSTSEKSKKEAEQNFQKELDKAKEKGELEEGVAEVVNVMKDLFEGFSKLGSSDDSLSFLVEDEKEQIVEIVVLNEKGEKINYGTTKYGDNKLTINLEEQITEKSTMKVLIENHKSVQTFNFELLNILLP